VTLWPSQNCDRAGRDAWVTHGDGFTRQVPVDAAKNVTPLMTLLPRHYHARIIRHYPTTLVFQH
jgi:hypothetical protein